MAREIVNESNEIWGRISPWWDAHIGEGNDFQTELIMPTTDELLGLKAGETVLDVACGNGNYARRMGRMGAKVLAIDVAEGFIEQARKRTSAADGEIEYQVIDATDEMQLAALGPARFDAAVSSMALMDLPEIRPLMQALAVVLKPKGRFVFSVSHPCFSSNRSRRTAELINEDGKVKQEFGMWIGDYLDVTPYLNSGIIHQPEPHYMFHRPLSALFRECFEAGFVVDGFEEPAFGWKASANAFSWEKRPGIPPAVIVRVRKKE